MKGIVLSTILLLSSIVQAATDDLFVPPQVFENTKHDQVYDLSGSYIKKSVALGIKNVAKTEQTEYYFAIEQDLLPGVVVEARESSRERPMKLEPTDLVNTEKNAAFFKLTFSEPLAPKAELDLSIGIAIMDQVKPLPETAPQDDEQWVLFQGSRYAFSAYPTVTQKLALKTLGVGVEELAIDSKDKADIADGLVKYGSYKSKEPFSAKPFQLRYHNPRALTKVDKLDRDIWVSHWGSSISFEETYWLKNIGTKLKSSFSRLDFQKQQSKLNLNLAAIREIDIPLKGEARDAYYYDLVGNVSTSNFRTNARESRLTIRPRYPVFGGWNYNFTIGWSYDLIDYVKSLPNDEYLLKIPFIDGPQDVYYETVNLNIILPEGASNAEVLSIFEAQENITTTFSFLDSKGRTAIQMKYNNILDSHKRGEIFVKYKYDTKDALRKPLSIAGTFFAIFVIALILGNLDISITKTLRKSKP